ncbi:MAG TPA: prepilin-type N-terminal cleavage/methylation domain-containing protein [Gemmatimonadales bacterium]|jgi:Tfp pilus assembly protein PilV
MTRLRKEGGFTLISVLVAVVMLAFGLMALARTQSILMTAENGVANRSAALSVAAGYLEQLRSRDPATLASEAPVAVDAEGAPAAGGPYYRSTVVTQDQANLLRVRVLVTFARASQPIELITLIYRKTT